MKVFRARAKLIEASNLEKRAVDLKRLSLELREQAARQKSWFCAGDIIANNAGCRAIVAKIQPSFVGCKFRLEVNRLNKHGKPITQTSVIYPFDMKNWVKEGKQ